MKKYLTVFSLSFQNEFTYRLNFILWRFRNVLRILMTFFLWQVVFSTRTTAFGYSHSHMFSYILFVFVIQALVMAAPSNDNIGGEIGNGDLSNYLVKPISYLKYWLTRDLASKLLNALFAVVEIGLLWLVFRPQLYISSDIFFVVSGLVAWVMAIILYFFIAKIAVFSAFWIPENTWGLMFIILVCMETLAGGIFPLDVLPTWVQSILQFTPFPYMVYYPIGMLIGKFSTPEIFAILLKSTIWLALSYWAVIRIWHKGLHEYSAVGR